VFFLLQVGTPHVVILAGTVGSFDFLKVLLHFFVIFRDSLCIFFVFFVLFFCGNYFNFFVIFFIFVNFLFYNYSGIYTSKSGLKNLDVELRGT